MRALVIGGLPNTARDGLSYAGTRGQAEVEFVEGLRALDGAIGGGDVSCVFVAGRKLLSAVVEAVRSRPDCFAIPVVALVARPSERDYRGAYAAGADDALIITDLGGITRRLANLSQSQPNVRPPDDLGSAVIGFPDHARRRLLGRTLRQAGFHVTFAGDTEELVRAASGPEAPSLVVASPSFPPDGGRAAIQAVRERATHSEVPALLLPPARPTEDGFDMSNGCGEQAGKLLFFAEEALRGQVKNLRATRRVLNYGMCAFREAGGLEPLYGLTHNISREGLYVRTLDPPPPGRLVWFEMRAPHTESPIHLRGTVVWRRPPAHMGGAAPPGFGMRIEAEQCPVSDIEAYRDGYDALCASDGSDLEQSQVA